MAKPAKRPYEGRLKALPKDKRVLRHWYPGWAVLVEKLTATSLRAKDLKRILGLSYRQIYHWHTRKLLWSERRTQTEWRRFSIADIFGLALIKRAAELGVAFNKLQRSLVIKWGLPVYLWRALPYLVAGRRVYISTDLERYCDLIMQQTETVDKTLRIPINSEAEDPIFVFPLKPVVNDLVRRLGLPSLKVLANTDGSYSFEINGVPLRLEDLRYTEKSVQEAELESTAMGRISLRYAEMNVQEAEQLLKARGEARKH